MVGARWPGQVEPAEAADDGQRFVAVGREGVGRVLLAIRSGHGRIDGLPGGLEQAAEDGLAGGEDGGLQLIQGGRGLEGGDIGQGHLDSGQFGQEVGGQVIAAADEDTEGAHDELLE